MCQTSAIIQYDRRNPEDQKLYQIILNNWNTFCAQRSEEGRDMQKYINDEFEGSLRCGIPA